MATTGTDGDKWATLIALHESQARVNEIISEYCDVADKTDALHARQIASLERDVDGLRRALVAVVDRLDRLAARVTAPAPMLDPRAVAAMNEALAEQFRDEWRPCSGCGRELRFDPVSGLDLDRDGPHTCRTANDDN